MFRKLDTRDRFFLIGIGGCGMRGVAKLLLDKGYSVSGSDKHISETTTHLKALGVNVYEGHSPALLKDATVCVYSTAITPDNCLLRAAQKKGLLILHRSEILAFIMKSYPQQIAVSGTHGKTTTTAMLCTVLGEDQGRPGFFIGSELQSDGRYAERGDDSVFITESDESDGSFLNFIPTIGIVTNIEEEHMDFYGTKEKLLEAFNTFMSAIIDKKGVLIIHEDDTLIQELLRPEWLPYCRYYGLNPGLDFYAKNIQQYEEGLCYELWHKDEYKEKVSLKVRGTYNVLNSLAALLAATVLQRPLKSSVRGIANFLGTKRRFQLIHQGEGIRVYDDYAHHPTEIVATLSAIKACFSGHRIVCVFQPHRYSRTQRFMQEFANAFSQADMIVLTAIYAAHEPPVSGVSSNALASQIKELGKDVTCVPTLTEAVSCVLGHVQSGDIVITMGAGSIFKVAHEIARHYKHKALTSLVT